MTHMTSIWNPRGKDFIDSTLERSALIVFVEFCAEMSLGLNEISSVLDGRGKRVSIFHLGDVPSASLARAMGVSLPSWHRTCHSDLLRGRPGKDVFVGEMRYCLSCLVRGNHSTLFQLPQVDRCPVHHELLRMACPHCGRSIPTYTLALARNHLHCGACDRNLAVARRRLTLGGAGDHPRSESFDSLREAVAARPAPGESRSPARWELSPKRTASDLALVRLLRSHSIWSDALSASGFLNHRTASFRLPTQDAMPPERKAYALARGAAIEALARLAERLKAQYIELAEMPLRVEKAMHSAVRVDVAVSAVSASFWQTASGFDVHQFLRGELPPWSVRKPNFYDWLPPHVGAMYKLVEQAVLELFACFLLRNRRLQYGVQVAWSDMPDKARYLVPWRLTPQTPDAVDLQMRFRVDNPAIERLVSRYRHHWLQAAPAGASLLDLINQTPAETSEPPAANGSEVIWAWPFRGK